MYSGGNLALLVVAAADAKGERRTVIGVLRVGGGGRNFDDAVIGIDLAGGNRGRRAEMAVDHDDAIGNQLISGGDSLFRVAGVVDRDFHDGFAEDATLGVEVGDSLGRATGFKLGPKGGIGAGEGAGDTDLGLRVCLRCRQSDA